MRGLKIGQSSMASFMARPLNYWRPRRDRANFFNVLCHLPG